MAENALLDAVERTVLDTPDALAFEVEGERTTYGELWAASDNVAAAISAHSRDRLPVVVFGHKDFRMVAGFLGCLKSGHAFVPIDVELPASRIGDIVSQLDDPLFVAASSLPEALLSHVSAWRVIDISRDDLSQAAAFDEASLPKPNRSTWVSGEETHYIIFTSGSTGKPKGIEVSAENVKNFMAWVRTFPVVREGGRMFLDQPPYSFDLSEYELLGALSTGGCLHAVPRELTENTRALFDDLRTAGIEVWVSTPSFADMCLIDKAFDATLLPDVRLFLFCGEALSHATAAALRERFPHAIVANTYGPTESTVAVTYGEIGEAELADSAPLPVGVPRPGTEIRICDPKTSAAVPQGDAGEIVIVGDTVAKGYYRNPEKTHGAFFAASLHDGRTVRGYHTGDVGRLDAQGVLHCEGRLDSLVKLNGFRIELEDVEENIRELEGVEQACVVPVRHKGRIAYLKAFAVLSREVRAAGASDFEVGRSLKARLGKRVPAYMVPRRFVLRNALPITPNGKVDRRALEAEEARR